jgi:hypothetical protein
MWAEFPEISWQIPLLSEVSLKFCCCCCCCCCCCFNVFVLCWCFWRMCVCLFFNNLVMVPVSFPKYVKVVPSPSVRDHLQGGLVCVCFDVRKSCPCNRPWRVMRRRGSHIFSRQSAHRWRWDCQPSEPAALYPPARFLVLISVRGRVDTRAIVWLEGLSQLKMQWPHQESNPRPSDLWNNSFRCCSSRSLLSFVWGKRSCGWLGI